MCGWEGYFLWFIPHCFSAYMLIYEWLRGLSQIMLSEVFGCFLEEIHLFWACCHRSGCLFGSQYLGTLLEEIQWLNSPFGKVWQQIKLFFFNYALLFFQFTAIHSLSCHFPFWFFKLGVLTPFYWRFILWLWINTS